MEVWGRKVYRLLLVSALCVAATLPGSRPALAANVGLVSQYHYTDGVGYVHLVGEVRNNGTTNAEFIRIDFNLYDSGNVLLATEFTYTTAWSLAPGERSPYHETFSASDHPTFDHATIANLSAQDAPGPPNHYFSSVVTNRFVDSINYEHLVGETTNGNTVTCTYVQVIFTFYDAGGTAVDSDFTFINTNGSSDLGPGATASFEELHSHAIAYTSYALLTESSNTPPSPGSVPSSPRSVSATAGDGSATVSWSAPTSTGGLLVSYSVVAAPGGHSNSTTATTTTVSGLANGTTYTFTVTATNGRGSSAGVQSNAVIPFGPPGAPTGVVASPSDQSAFISWSPPASNGGNAVSSYTVTASPGGATMSTAGTALSLTGLTNGISYTFTVTAANAAGSGPASSPSAAVTPATYPAAPTGVMATRGNASAFLSWSTPTSDGGSPISTYQIVASPGGASMTSSGPSSTFVGLTNGTSYAFTVRALNGVGFGPYSAPSNSVTPATTPGSVSALTALPLPLAARLKWNPSASDGGSAISVYAIAVAPGGATYRVGAGDLSIDVPNLSRSVAYTFTVTATNGVGEGPGLSVGLTAIDVPGAVTALSGHAGAESVYLSWVLPADNGGAAVIAYRITPSTNGTRLTPIDHLLPNTSGVVFGLVDGRQYTFEVQAVNAAGPGANSQPSATLTPDSSLKVPSAQSTEDPGAARAPAAGSPPNGAGR